VRIDKELDDLIQEQSLFEDSALEDASAYARMITKGADRFKKEKQDGRERFNGTE
jgi:hypothetical protein